MGSKGLLFKMVRCIIFIFLGAGVNFANCQDTVNFYNPEFWKFDSATINSLKLVFPKANIQHVIIQDSKAPDFVMDVYCLPLGSTGSPSNAYTRIGTYSTFVCEYTYDSNYFNICDGTEEDCLNKALEKCTLDQSCFGFAVPYNNFSQKGVYKCIHNSLSKATSSLMALYMKGIFKTQCGGGTERSCDAPCPNMANSNCMAGYVGEDNTDVLMDTFSKLNTMIQSSGSNYCQKKDFYPYLSTRKEELIEEIKNVTSRMRNDFASQNTPLADLSPCPRKIAGLLLQGKGIADCKPCCCYKHFINQPVCK